MATGRTDGENRRHLTYRDAGVDIDAQDEALDRIKEMVRSARTSGVLADLGSFGGLFSLNLAGHKEPILVSSCDGIGTKLKIAFETGINNTVGRDLVNHCVNDILVQGARPQFFMDYIATGKLDPAVLASVVEGVAAGCREAGCALLGGETAEMPGFYGDGEYDVAGFIVGLVDRGGLIDGSSIQEGDLLVGLPSAGLHTNGFSLARKIFFEVEGLSVDSEVGGLGRTAGEELLTEHRSYLQQLSGLLETGLLHGLAHITGGGLTDNIPRILPDGLAVEIEKGKWPPLPVFEYLQDRGGVPEDDMYRTFNMGVGMVVIVSEEDTSVVEKHLDRVGEAHFRIGRVTAGDGQVRYG